MATCVIFLIFDFQIGCLMLLIPIGVIIIKNPAGKLVEMPSNLMEELCVRWPELMIFPFV